MRQWRLLITALGCFHPLMAFAQQSAMDLVKAGDAKFSGSDYEGAVADYSKAIELDPKSASAYSGRALAEVSLAEAGKGRL